MHPDNGRVDHLHRRVMSGRERFHDPTPDATPSPANEAIVAGSIADPANLCWSPIIANVVKKA